jgi:hypothetical protein
MVPTLTWIIRWGRRPPLPRQHRHAYAAGINRGLPTGPVQSASELAVPPVRPLSESHEAHCFRSSPRRWRTAGCVLAELPRARGCLA